MKKDDDFWDAEFLYNVPSLFKGDFFGEENSSDTLQCTYEINTPNFDILTETASSDDDEEVIEEKSVESLESLEKRTCFKCTGCRRSFCKSFKFLFYF